MKKRNIFPHQFKIEKNEYYWKNSYHFWNSPDTGGAGSYNWNQDSLSGQAAWRHLHKEAWFHSLFSHNYLYSFEHNSIFDFLASGKEIDEKRI